MMQTKRLEPSTEYVLAPDGSVVRPLLDLRRGGLGIYAPAQCGLPGCPPPDDRRGLVLHQRAGLGLGKHEDREDVVEVGPGVCLIIPTSVHFQFRNTGDGPLEFLMATMPPWPGADEAVRVPDHWEPR
jgi:hypothetical protein